MKNFLALDNLILESKDNLNNIIQSSSEVNECPITNILEDNSNLIWISSEELPQEITLNLSRSFFKEYPKKLKALGIYCWHAYPTNPKLVEILISKNNDNNFISFGNFDLCLKPGKQLLQLDENENNKNFLITENNNYIIKLIIKETYGDKRTYINNIYLYENIDYMNPGIINTINTIETIKEEEDSSSIFYLRESRERTLPRKKNKNIFSISSNNNSGITNNINDINNLNNLNNINNQKQSKNEIKINDELNNKDLTIDEFEIITKTKIKDNKVKEKNDKNNININMNNTYDNDESNINNNILGTESQFIGTNSLFSSRNNLNKNEDLTNKNILLTKTNDNIDNIDEESNNIIKNISLNEIKEKNDNKENNNFRKTIESLDDSLSSEDFESFGILKGTKTHQKNFFIPPKVSEKDEDLENPEFQHSSSVIRFKTKNEILNKKFTENYFNMQNSYSQKNNKNTKINSISQNNNKNNNLNEINKNNLKNNSQNEKIDNVNKIKEKMSLFREEFLKFKKQQEEIITEYQNKITNLESHIKKLEINSSKMSDVVKTLLEAQYIQNQANNDNLLNQMKKVATETFVNIFSNISQLANLDNTSSPTITTQNHNQNRQSSLPFNENTQIDMNENRQKQKTYQTSRRKIYSIDKINKPNYSYSINNNIINNNIKSKKNIYNKKFNDNLSAKTNKLKKYNSGRNIILKKNYINKNKNQNNNINDNQNNFIIYDLQKLYVNSDTIESKSNIEEEQRNENENLLYQESHPKENNKKYFKKLKNINTNEILKLDNNNLNNNILNDKNNKRLFTNCYKRKTFSPIKRIQYSHIIYTDSDNLFPETTVNASNQTKKNNFNLYNNENFNENIIDNEDNDKFSYEDKPLKVSQLKTEKKINKLNNIIDNKDNYNEEKDNENRKNSDINDTLNYIRNKLEDEQKEELKQNSNNKKQKYDKDNINNKEEKGNFGNVEIINNNRKKKLTVKNDSLINLIQKYNKDSKDINKEGSD